MEPFGSAVNNSQEEEAEDFLQEIETQDSQTELQDTAVENGAEEETGTDNSISSGKYEESEILSVGTSRHQDALAVQKELKHTLAKSTASAEAQAKRHEELLKKERIRKAVEAAEKKFCKPVNVKGDGWRLMCSEKAYANIRKEKQKAIDDFEEERKQRKDRPETPQVTMLQEKTFQAVAGSATLWKQMMVLDESNPSRRSQAQADGKTGEAMKSMRAKPLKSVQPLPQSSAAEAGLAQKNAGNANVEARVIPSVHSPRSSPSVTPVSSSAADKANRREDAEVAVAPPVRIDSPQSTKQTRGGFGSGLAYLFGWRSQKSTPEAMPPTLSLATGEEPEPALKPVVQKIASQGNSISRTKSIKANTSTDALPPKRPVINSVKDLPTKPAVKVAGDVPKKPPVAVGSPKPAAKPNFPPPRKTLVNPTLDSLDLERWQPLFDIQAGKVKLETDVTPAGHCSSARFLKYLEPRLDQHDLSYLSYAWPWLEHIGTTGLRFRFPLKNITSAKVARPDDLEGEDSVEKLRKAISRGKRKGSWQAPPPDVPEVNITELLAAQSSVDVDAVLDILAEDKKRRRVLLRETLDRDASAAGEALSRRALRAEGDQWEDIEAEEEEEEEPAETGEGSQSGEDFIEELKKMQAEIELKRDSINEAADSAQKIIDGIHDNKAYTSRNYSTVKAQALENKGLPGLSMFRDPATIDQFPTGGMPLLAHKMQFFPDDYADNTSLKYCPHSFRANRVPCKPWERRLPHLEELSTELKIKGISVQKEDALRMDHTGATHLTFKRELLSALPMEDSHWRFDTCAVVGNSGVLRGSKHGAAIDAHDAVFRTNMAPTAGFEEDVGSRTTFDIINQQHTKSFCPHVHAGGMEAESMRAPLRNSTILVFEILSPFARHHLYAPLLRRFNSPKASSSTMGSKVAVLSPELILHAYRVWHVTKVAVELASHNAKYVPGHFLLKPMSGFFATMFSLQVCKKVDLYGFSSYHPHRQGSAAEVYDKAQMRYHYFDNVAGVTRHHSFDLAYELFHQMSHWPCSDANVTVNL
ncbi:glycosyltransferase 29 protein [Cymbomonas tetramitiformis]|uniref:Glycosyltransferase 29 protein n=2 Tax=Cymbomonas tetramitiformis TaxID=36881 RepID=A0AAE0C0S8_9CHLO|nr:glycosyltransferase 29 protein [Cymbomonas tetramitiformis]